MKHTHLVIIGATVAAGGFIYWHKHKAPSPVAADTTTQQAIIPPIVLGGSGRPGADIPYNPAVNPITTALPPAPIVTSPHTVYNPYDPDTWPYGYMPPASAYTTPAIIPSTQQGSD